MDVIYEMDFKHGFDVVVEFSPYARGTKSYNFHFLSFYLI